MVIALVIVFILFCALLMDDFFFAQNMSNLMLQNGYVLVLACGMLLCILTGGNIDLSVGSVICFVGGVAAVLIGSKGFNPLLTIILCLVIGLWLVSGRVTGLVIREFLHLSQHLPACSFSVDLDVWYWIIRQYLSRTNLS